MNYGFVIDNSACIGCHACSTACKSENQVPLGVNRTWVKYTEAGRYPDVRRAFQVTRCNHCANPPCVRICPVQAMYQRDDGIVEFDGDACIGCKGCLQACPYDAIYIDPDTHTAAKCHFCSHRTDIGLEPACVVVCPEHAIIAGDLDDPESEISRVVARHNTAVRKPEQGTAPKLFYIEGNELALTPTALDQPEGFLFADVQHDDHGHRAGARRDPARAAPRTRVNDRGTTVRVPQRQGLPDQGPVQVGGRMAGHMAQVTWNAQHDIPWHWHIPTYLITKHVGAGVFFLLALTALIPALPFSSAAMVVGGALGMAMTVATLILLVLDLDRPDRFFYLLVRPQWRSWIARAAWILSGFSLVGGLWWALETAAWLGWIAPGVAASVRPGAAVLALPLAVLASLYTAFLFAQAEGRDLWQSPHVPVQMAFHGLLLGALPLAAMPLVVELPAELVAAARGLAIAALAGSAVTTLVGDLGIPKATEVAQRASDAMLRGKWSTWTWWGGLGLGHVVPLALLAFGTPALALGALLFASVGLFMYEYAFVMAPQEVPNS